MILKAVTEQKKGSMGWWGGSVGKAPAKPDDLSSGSRTPIYCPVFSHVHGLMHKSHPHTDTKINIKLKRSIYIKINKTLARLKEMKISKDSINIGNEMRRYNVIIKRIAGNISNPVCLWFNHLVSNELSPWIQQTTKIKLK